MLKKRKLNFLLVFLFLFIFFGAVNIEKIKATADQYSWFRIPAVHYEYTPEPDNEDGIGIQATFTDTCEAVCTEIGESASADCTAWNNNSIYCRRTGSPYGSSTSLASASTQCDETNWISRIGQDYCCCTGDNEIVVDPNAPDLTITKVEISPTNPKGKESITSYITIKNIGNSDMTEKVDISSGGGILEFDELLKAGESTVLIRSNFSLTVPGINSVYYGIDASNKIDEINEDNNEYVKEIDVFPTYSGDGAYTLTHWETIELDNGKILFIKGDNSVGSTLYKVSFDVYNRVGEKLYSIDEMEENTDFNNTEFSIRVDDITASGSLGINYTAKITVESLENNKPDLSIKTDTLKYYVSDGNDGFGVGQVIAYVEVEDKNKVNNELDSWLLNASYNNKTEKYAGFDVSEYVRGYKVNLSFIDVYSNANKTYSVIFRADPQDIIDESNENNNSYTKSIVIKVVNTEEELVSYWDFDNSSALILEDNVDGNNGEIRGAKRAGGVSGSALYFDGDGDYVVVPHNSNLNFGTGDFTVSLWVKTSASTYPHDLDRDEILSKGNAFNSGITLSSRHDRFSGYIGRSSREQGYNINNTVINDGVWHNMVMLRRGGVLKVYTDGDLEHSYSRSDSVDVPYNLYIGRHGTKGESYFKGKIDETKIYSYALTDTEVENAYNEVRSGYSESTERRYDNKYGFTSDSQVYTTKILDVYPVDKLVSGDYDTIAIKLNEQLPAGTKLSFDLVGWADDRYVSYEANGLYKKKWFIHPTVGVGTKKLTVWIMKDDGRIIDTKTVDVQIIDPSTQSNYDQESVEINTIANDLSDDEKFDEILVGIKEVRDVVKENENKIKYLEELKKDILEIKEAIEDAINNFITYGVDENTKRLGAGERAAVMYSFKSAFNRLPKDEEDLAEAIRIANGRWPKIKSEEAEKRAKKMFQKIYKRISDMEDPYDNAAVVVMAYGLRQRATNRNLNSERVGIQTFTNIYGHHPQTTDDWNIMQSIAYSGATRGIDTDRDLLTDEREKELGTDINDPDSDNDGFLDGIEVANGYNPLGEGKL